MLRTDLIDLINGGGAWVFVGSGVSSEADYPSWRSLVEGVITATPLPARQSVLDDPRYQSAWSESHYEACFSAIERHTDRQHLESSLAALLKGTISKATVAQIIAAWPFAGYATSNYDDLLEHVLAKHPGGWVSVGNTDDELRKVSGDASGIIWHVHGGINLPAERSSLIVTVADYERVYLEGSRLQKQMSSLLSQRRFVFVGFGFNDPEFLRLLKIVSKYTSPTAPIIAFLSDVPKGYPRRLALLEDCNVDVVPYEIVNGSHRALRDLLDMYSPFILSRTLKFGQPLRPCPSYDPETTALLTYNRLALAKGTRVEEDAINALLRARILALLRHQGSCSLEALTQDLLERAHVLAVASHAAVSERDYSATLASISTALAALESEDLVVRFEDAGSNVIDLTDSGRGLTSDQSARAQLMSDQFRASLTARIVSEHSPLDAESCERVVSACEAFLKESVARRALGVAMVWNSPTADFQQFHMVALLQALPQYTEQMASASEAQALISLVRSVLSEPTDPEALYLGLLVQSHFGVHLLGLDPDAVSARIRELSQTLFVLDATTLIPLLARSSTGNAASTQLLSQINTVGATAATTDLLAVEVAEHARWALRSLGSAGDVSSLRGLAASSVSAIPTLLPTFAACRRGRLPSRCSRAAWISAR